MRLLFLGFPLVVGCVLFSMAAFADGYIQMRGKKTILKSKPSKQAPKQDSSPPNDKLGSYMKSPQSGASSPTNSSQGSGPGALTDMIQNSWQTLKNIQKTNEEHNKQLKELENEL